MVNKDKYLSLLKDASYRPRPIFNLFFWGARNRCCAYWHKKLTTPL